jgi:hypothetical protein
MELKEILDNLQGSVKRYENVPLIDTNELSEILRTLGVNLSYLVQLRNEYYTKFQSTYFNSQGKTEASKNRESEYKVPELDLIRKILRHYSALQQDIRTQISLHKVDR